jgi:hypothetical protein
MDLYKDPDLVRCLMKIISKNAFDVLPSQVIRDLYSYFGDKDIGTLSKTHRDFIPQGKRQVARRIEERNRVRNEIIAFLQKIGFQNVKYEKRIKVQYSNVSMHIYVEGITFDQPSTSTHKFKVLSSYMSYINFIRSNRSRIINVMNVRNEEEKTEFLRLLEKYHKVSNFEPFFYYRTLVLGAVSEPFFTPGLIIIRQQD